MKVALLVPGSTYTGNVARDLIYGCWCKGNRIAGLTFPPLSTLVVGAVLQQSGHTVELIDAQAERLSIQAVQRRIKGFDAAVILTSTTTLNEDSLYLLNLKDEHKDLFTIAFGGHVTAEPESSLTGEGREGAIDVIARREPELIVKNVIGRLAAGADWRDLDGISYRDGQGKIISNPDAELISDLDTLPIADRNMLPKVTYFNPVVKRYPFTTMFTSRGCPGRCIYCASPYFYGRVERAQSAERVLAELEYCAGLGYKEIFFRDENFTTNRDRVMDICAGIRRRSLDLTWICSTRATHIDREMMVAMKASGCHMLRLGVESGVQELLNNVRKGVKLERLREVFAHAHEVGLQTHAHLMVGLPGETESTFKQTVRFVKEIDPTIATFGILTAYPGTPLFYQLRGQCPEVGDGTVMDLSVLHTQAFFNQQFCSLSPEQLAGMVRSAYRSFYLRPSYMLKRLLDLRSGSIAKQYLAAGIRVLEFSFGKN